VRQKRSKSCRICEYFNKTKRKRLVSKSDSGLYALVNERMALL